MSLLRLPAAVFKTAAELGQDTEGTVVYVQVLPSPFRYLFAIHQGLTTSTGWKEIAPQCRWDRTGEDRLRIRVSVFNTEAEKKKTKKTRHLYRNTQDTHLCAGKIQTYI